MKIKKICYRLHMFIKEIQEVIKVYNLEGWLVSMYKITLTIDVICSYFMNIFKTTIKQFWHPQYKL